MQQHCFCGFYLLLYALTFCPNCSQIAEVTINTNFINLEVFPHTNYDHILYYKFCNIVYLRLSTSLGLNLFVYILTVRKHKNRLIYSKTKGTDSGHSHNKHGVKVEDLPIIGFEILSNATGKFDPLNKLGQGGFGPVYKVSHISIFHFLLILLI